MCPACLAGLALIAGGATSAGGVAAVIVKHLRARRSRTKTAGIAVPISRIFAGELAEKRREMRPERISGSAL